MSGVPGVTCARCLGRIDEQAFDVKRRVAKALGKTYEPPLHCSDCVMAMMLRLGFGGEDDPKTNGGPP